MNAATAEVIQFPEPEHDVEHDDGGPHEPNDWLLCFLARLVSRVRGRSKLHGVVVEQELWALFAEYSDENDLPEQAEKWRAMAADAKIYGVHHEL